MKISDINNEDLGTMIDGVALRYRVQCDEINENIIRQTLQSEYKNLSVNDFNEAFIKHCSGKFTISKNPDNNKPYGDLSTQFLCQVINAYKEHKALKLRLNPPKAEPLKELTAMSIDKNKQAIKAFNEFKKKGSYFDFSNIIYKHLDETGVLNVSTKRKKAFWEKAKQNIIHDLKTGSNHMEKISMKVMIKAVEVGSRNQKIKADAMRLALTDYFQGLVDMEMDIEGELIK